MQSLDLLKQHGIVAQPRQVGKRSVLIVEDTNVSPAMLRSLGFRVGSGKNDIRYLLYQGGRMQGVVTQDPVG